MIHLERLLDKRLIRRGAQAIPQVLVKWKGLPEALATWEGEADVQWSADITPA